MATTNKIRIGSETRDYEDTQARQDASTALQKAEQALTDASEALQEAVALESELANRIKAILPSLLPQETVLWTGDINATSMESQTIPNIDFSPYDKVKMLWFNTNDNEGWLCETEMQKIGSGNAQFYLIKGKTSQSETNVAYYIRNIGYSGSNKELIIRDCFAINLGSSATDVTYLSNGNCIPYQVIGIKNPS